MVLRTMSGTWTYVVVAGDARHRIVGENRVENGVGDGVRDLIGMTLGDRFRCEEMTVEQVGEWRGASVTSGENGD